MNDLPASWAGLAPFLFLVGGAVSALVAAWGGSGRAGVRRSPAGIPAGFPAGVVESRQAPSRTAQTPRTPGQPPLLPVWLFLRTRMQKGARVAARHPAVVVTGALAGFGLSIGRQPVVAFLGLFMIPTAALGYGAFRGRGGLRAFVMFAAADLMLAFAVMHRHSATGLWTTPLPGRVGAGALAAALAAALRLGARWARARRDPAQSGLVSVGWWQGLFLAWWAGPAAGGALAGAALVLWALGVASARSRRDESALLFAGGLAALLAALGGGATTLAVVGLAGAAFVMGERAVSVATLALAPLSATAVSGMVPLLHPWLPAALAAFTLAWASALHHLLLADPPRSGGRVPAAFAAAGTVGLMASRGAELLMWAAYGIGLSALVAAAVVRPAPEGAVEDAWAGEGGPQDAVGVETVRDAGLAVLGACLLAVALLVEAELTFAGLRTGFL